jgi:twitching motility protein PilU
MGLIRDRETMHQAIFEAGHLCLSTLHSNNANHALDRILILFQDTARPQLQADLSLNLKAVVSPRMLAARHGDPRVPAVEILPQTTHVSEFIARDQIDDRENAMKASADRGMQTFDESLFQLFPAGRIGLRRVPSEEQEAKAKTAADPSYGWIDGQVHGVRRL